MKLWFVFLFLTAVAASRRSGSMYCPNPMQILPCKCEVEFGEASIVCEHIRNEDVLEKVFQASFPHNLVHQFLLTDSAISTISRNVFGAISFEVVEISNSNITSIGEKAFKNSYSTLQKLYVSHCLITHDSFPFSSLGKYTQLKDTRFSSNKIAKLPRIDSPSITSLSLSLNPISKLPSRALENLPNLCYFYISYGNLYEIENDAFVGAKNLAIVDFFYNGFESVTADMFGSLENLGRLSLGGNVITTIEKGSFLAFPNLEELDLFKNRLTHLGPRIFDGLKNTNMYLHDNRIQDIADDAFGSISNSIIELENNKIRLLEESWMRPLLDRNNTLEMKGNPCECGCEIAWIFDDRKYVKKVKATCPDGTEIKDLDPNVYIEQC